MYSPKLCLSCNINISLRISLTTFNATLIQLKYHRS
uniref:Uncharacterized protein n=1 Tax=Anguilla anguilla TaxID=7936 RepID=A0A0E9VN29_ANGAN